MSIFSKNLKYLRECKNLSQNRLGEMAGVNQTTIARWENEEISPSLDNIIDVSEVLNVSVADLTGTDLTKDEYSYNELDYLLSSRAKQLNDDEKKAVLNVINAIIKEYDENSK